MSNKEAYEVVVTPEYLTRDQKILINNALGMYCRVGTDLLEQTKALELASMVYDIRQWLMNTPTAEDGD